MGLHPNPWESPGPINGPIYPPLFVKVIAGGIGVVFVGAAVVATAGVDTVIVAGTSACVRFCNTFANIFGVGDQTPSETVGGQVGNQLPQLTGSLGEAFNGEIKTLTLEPGQIFYRVEANGATMPGRWLGTEKPLSMQQANELYNIKIWNNPMQQIGEYKVVKPVIVYYGQVAGGTGWQIYIPKNILPQEVFTQIRNSPLPQ